MVYDITRRDTFKNIQQWHQDAIENGNQQMRYLLIGNKCDLESEREVNKHDGQIFADNNDMQFMETSAKTGWSVEEAFLKLTAEIYQNYMSDRLRSNPGIKEANGLQKSSVVSRNFDSLKDQRKEQLNYSREEYEEYFCSKEQLKNQKQRN